MTFAQRVKALRDECALTQQDLAQRLGVSAGAIAHWESGRSEPRPKEMRRFEDLEKGAVRLEASAARISAPSALDDLSGPRDLHKLLDTILDSGKDDAIEAIANNLTVFSRYVQGHSEVIPGAGITVRRKVRIGTNWGKETARTGDISKRAR